MPDVTKASPQLKSSRAFADWATATAGFAAGCHLLAASFFFRSRGNYAFDRERSLRHVIFAATGVGELFEESLRARVDAPFCSLLDGRCAVRLRRSRGSEYLLPPVSGACLSNASFGRAYLARFECFRVMTKQCSSCHRCYVVADG